jgi:hypothetical protein
MNLVTRQIYGNKKGGVPNTFIGGVASTISTPALLASKLAIDVSRITNFSIVGSDIKCRITGSYAIPFNAFNTGEAITYYDDQESIVTSAGEASFKNNNLKWVNLKSATLIGNNCFEDVSGNQRDFVYIPSCTSLGLTSGNNSVFNSGYQTKIIYANPFLSTNNAGSEDGDLAYARSQGSDIRFVTNFTAPNAVTTLTPGTIYNTAIQLNFTPPSSTNTIDYYEVYANGIFIQKITGSGEVVTGLNVNTNYNIFLKAIDVFYNKSITGNSISVSTINTMTDSDAIAYMKASGNVNYEIPSNTLFVSLKSNSLYTKIQAFYPFLGTKSTQHKWNAKNPLDTDGAFRITFNGSGTYTNLGYTPNGINGYGNSHFIPSAIQNINSNGLTIAIGTNNLVVGSEAFEIGAYSDNSSVSFVSVKQNNSSYNRLCGLNTNSPRISSAGVNEAKGVFTGSKTASNLHKLFRNESVLATGSGGGNLASVKVWIGCLNLTNTVYGPSNQRIQFTAIHEGLSDVEVTALHTIINTFETALCRKTW